MGSGEVMEPRDVVVVGGSAGSLEPLSQLAAALPADTPGSIAVTIHIGEQARSRLPQILQRQGPLPPRMPGQANSCNQGASTWPRRAVTC